MFNPSSMLGPRWFVLAGVLAAAACAAEPPPRAQDGESQVDRADQDKIDRAKAKIAEANRAYDARQYDKARALLKQAASVGADSQAYDIAQLTDKIDKREAGLYANEAKDKLDKRDCMGALNDLAAAIDVRKSDAFEREVRRLVTPPAIKCLNAQVDSATLAAHYAEARKLVSAENTKKVLGQAEGTKLSEELDTTILEALKAAVNDDVKARRWAAAVEKVDLAVKKGDADDTLAAAVLATIRAGGATDISALVDKAVGQRDAAVALQKADALIKTLRWEIPDPKVAVLGDRVLPDELRQKRDVLAVWVESQRVAMRPLATPEKRWTYGKVALAPRDKSDGDASELLPDKEVWVLGQTRSKALVADADPGSGPLAAQLAKAVGWVSVERLAKESTTDWLPPDDQLKGVRVWAPLRPPDALLELGTVAEVSGNDISVKRLADDVVIKVPRKSVRNGRLAPGTKVLTFCTANGQPGQVVQLLPGARGVKLKCDSGQEKDEFLPGLRTKPELLPAPKQSK